MIVFDLLCRAGHGFEGWFSSSQDYAHQRETGLLSCPQCGSVEIDKAPMAPAVPRKGNQQVVMDAGATGGGAGPPAPVSNMPIPPEVRVAIRKLAEAQARALENSTWVGKRFADQARAMHYGEQDHAAIHGEASMAEAEALLEEGIEVAPLPFPVAGPEELN